MSKFPRMFIGFELLDKKLNWSFDLLRVNVGKESFVLLAFRVVLVIIDTVGVINLVGVHQIRKYKELKEESMIYIYSCLVFKMF